MRQINIGDITIDVVRKNIKHIHLSVYPPDGRVRIAAPLSIHNDAVKRFAILQLSWIRKKQRAFENQERQAPRLYKNRESHYYLGKKYLLNVVEVDAPPKVVLRNKTYIDLYVRPNATIEKKSEIMKEWYRAQLKSQVPELIKKWEKKMKLNVAEFHLKQMKTIWGSCNKKEKRLLLNLELAKKPFHCIEYIVVHEMVHFFERHHNDRFTAHINHFLPKWKNIKAELNRMPVGHGEWGY